MITSLLGRRVRIRDGIPVNWTETDKATLTAQDKQLLANRHGQRGEIVGLWTRTDNWLQFAIMFDGGNVYLTYQNGLFTVIPEENLGVV